MGTWRAWVLAVFGAWFVASTWLLPAVAWNSIVFGGLILLGGLWLALDRPQEMTWRSWLTALFAAWLAVSPWLLNYAANTTSAVVTLIVGVLAAACAVWMAVAPGTLPAPSSQPVSEVSARKAS